MAFALTTATEDSTRSRNTLPSVEKQRREISGNYKIVIQEFSPLACNSRNQWLIILKWQWEGGGVVRPYPFYHIGFLSPLECWTAAVKICYLHCGQPDQWRLSPPANLTSVYNFEINSSFSSTLAHWDISQ